MTDIDFYSDIIPLIQSAKSEDDWDFIREIIKSNDLFIQAIISTFYCLFCDDYGHWMIKSMDKKESNEIFELLFPLIKKNQMSPVIQMIGKSIEYFGFKENGNEIIEISFHTENNYEKFIMRSYSEFVNAYCADIIGHLDSLTKHPILKCEVITVKLPDLHQKRQLSTYYKISNIHTTIQFRWIGSSDGYYCEKIDFKYKNYYDILH